MRLRRDILLFGALAVLALGAGWWLLTNRPGAAVDAFRAEDSAREQASVRKPTDAAVFRATVCGDRSCVVVEAGGLTFVVGAGAGTAEGLRSQGLLRPDMDGVLLTDLRAGTLEGLPGLAVALHRAGRRGALKVWGPAGIVAVVDGMKLMVSSDAATPLQVGQEGEDQGLDGLVVFDSGVVTVRAFGKALRTYRFDIEGKSLVVAGCSAAQQDIVNAARGAASVSAVLAAWSKELRPLQSDCLETESVLQAIGQGRIAATLVIPGDPPASAPYAIPAWRHVLAGKTASAGGLGATLDLTGHKPEVNQSH